MGFVFRPCIPRLLLFCVFVTNHSFLVTAQVPQPGKIVILHWNDFHAQNKSFFFRDSSNATLQFEVGGAANLAGYIDSIRSGEKNVLSLDAGDDDQGTPISTITAGRIRTRILSSFSAIWVWNRIRCSLSAGTISMSSWEDTIISHSLRP